MLFRKPRSFREVLPCSPWKIANISLATKSAGVSGCAWAGSGRLACHCRRSCERSSNSAHPFSPPLRNLGGATFGRAKNVIFLWLQGGPPQHETFDPKPNAPAEIRGPFRPIATNVPGIRFCELLPRTARHADKLAIVRLAAHQ